MNTVLYRWYTNKGKATKQLQGKVFEVKGKDIFYRDLHEHKGRLWLDEGAWNIDFRTFTWLLENGVKEIHYYWHKDKQLYKVSTERARRWLDKGRLEIKRIGGHRQIFLPKDIFTLADKDYSDPWIKSMTDAGRESGGMAFELRLRLANEWRYKYG